MSQILLLAFYVHAIYTRPSSFRPLLQPPSDAFRKHQFTTTPPHAQIQLLLYFPFYCHQHLKLSYVQFYVLTVFPPPLEAP